MQRTAEGLQTDVRTDAWGPAVKFLRLFTDIRPGEVSKALLLALNIFLLLLAYYIIKPVRNALLLSGNEAEVQSYLGGAQAVLLIFVVKVFSSLSSRMPRHVLIARVTLFFISNLFLFYGFHLLGMDVGLIGILFFIWIGIFNILVVAQFWGFANDLYTEEEGKRIFPLIAFGATLGGVCGSTIADRLILPLGVYRMMLVSAVVLGVCIYLAVLIHRREIRACDREGADCSEERKAFLKNQQQPLKKGGGFNLVFRSRYLLYIALLMGIYNFINAVGEYIINDVSQQAARQAILSGTAGGLGMEEIIGRFFADYQFLTNVLALIIQIFLVSRIFKWVGVAGALFFLPAIAIGGYGTIALGASLAFVKWAKAAENGTDYSLMNTTRAALFLITPREEKYKAKAAIDTFFVRGGDALAAAAVFAGTTFFAASVQRFAAINIAMTGIWILLCVLIARQYRRMKAAPSGSPPDKAAP
jgi:ATP:ADP antiporter, AAA family